ncbi:MAG: hypothetical protein LUH22_14140 [Bacteroides sp.]|nr:hypothetical protein [Bacteroides sp.]
MKVLFLLLVFISCPFVLFGQETTISEELKVIKLADHTYLHTGNDNNGVIFVHRGEAIIVSTPETEQETRNLIDWVRGQNWKIVGYILDRWHPDAMGGIKAVHQAGIQTYANELTQSICKEKGLPIPHIGFHPLLELKVGGEKVIAHYLGPAHTEDGIVVWFPKDKILFGGNEVRSQGGWYGNIGDANLKEWSNTISNVKENYGSAEIVVPGHGKYGGVELLDYTINRYKPSKWGNILTTHNIQMSPVFQDYDRIFEVAQSDSVAGDKRYLKEATVFVKHSQKYLKIMSPDIAHNATKKMLSSDSGRLQIYHKATNELMDDLYYKQLYVNLRDDEVEWTVIIKEAIR